MRKWLDSTPIRFLEVLGMILGLGLTIGGLIGVLRADSRLLFWIGTLLLFVGLVFVLAASSVLLREQCKYCNGEGKVHIGFSTYGPCPFCRGRGKRWIIG